MDALRSALPAGHALGRAQGPRDADHRRARAGQARRLRRRDRLPQLHRRPRHLHPHPHRGGQGRRRPRAGRRRHRRRRPARLRVRGVRGQGARACCGRSSWRSSSPTGHDHAVLVVDNYDSFTYNLVQYLGELGRELEVVRNDRADRRRAARARLRPRRRLARAVHAQRGRHLRRRHAPLPRGRRADARACAWATSRSRRPSAARSSATCPSTARRRRSSTTAGRSSRGCPRPLTVGRYHSLVVDAERARLLRAHRPAAAAW